MSVAKPLSSVIALLNIRKSTLKRKLSSVKSIWIHCVSSLVTHQRTHSGEHQYGYSEWGNAQVHKQQKSGPVEDVGNWIESGKQNSLLKIVNSGILLLVHLATATLEKGSETTPK